MSNPYYNYSAGIIGDSNDNNMGGRADGLGEMLVISDIRDPNNTVSFIAFVSSFSQNFVSNWNTQEALGRMDDIATFKNTTRTISVGWDIPAPDADTAKENLNRCNALIAMLYPTYTNADTKDGGSFIMSKPPLVRLKYSNLISNTFEDIGLKGYITSLSWTPVLEMGSFHSAGKIYPKVISISIEFTALHEPVYSGGPTGYFETASGLQPSKGWSFAEDERAAGMGVQGSWPFGIGLGGGPNFRQEPPQQSPVSEEAPGDAEAEATEAEAEELTPRQARRAERRAKRAEKRAERQAEKTQNQLDRQARRLERIESRNPNPNNNGEA